MGGNGETGSADESGPVTRQVLELVWAKNNPPDSASELPLSPA